MAEHIDQVADTAADTARVELIPLSLIETQAQIRTTFDDEGLQQLAASVRAHGVIQPIVVRLATNGRMGPSPLNPYRVVAGERRLRAAHIAGIDAIPAIIRTLSDDEAVVVQALENLQREDLTLHDTAAGVATLVQRLGFDATCEQLGKSTAWVSKHSSINTMHPCARELVQRGDITSADIAHTVSQIMAIDSDYVHQMRHVYVTGNAPTRKVLREWLERAKIRAKRNERSPTAEPQQAAPQDSPEPPEPEEPRKPEPPAQHQAHTDAEETRRRDQQSRLIERTERVEELHQAMVPRRIEWTERLAAAIGVEPDRYADTNELVLYEPWDAIEGRLLVECGGPYVNDDYDSNPFDAELSEEPLPPTADGMRVVLHVELSQAQLESVIRTLEGAPPSGAPIRTGAVDAFIASRLRSDSAGRIRSSDLWAAYAQWCAEQRVAAIDPIALAEAIEAAGIEKRRFKDAKYFLGVALS